MADNPRPVSQMAPEAAPLDERLMWAAMDGCTCLAKSPDIQWHDPKCHYRLFTEAINEIAILRAGRTR